MAAVVIGAVAWATFTTAQLYQIKADLAVVVVRLEKLAEHEKRLERIEAAIWPTAWRQ